MDNSPLVIFFKYPVLQYRVLAQFLQSTDKKLHEHYVKILWEICQIVS
uniref:Uncharacterized protein n=1 Tax=Amphimedon queenslandica TaxID=400682 RepID=A0A1X7V8V3_AMPQE